MTGPVLVGALLTAAAGSARMPGSSGALAGRWSLVGAAGLWCADCLVPGCGWTTTTATSETASIAATLHDLTHPATPGTSPSMIGQTGRTQ